MPCRAHADLVGSLGTVSAPATVAFHNSDVQPAPGHGSYDFLDQWNFTLSPAATVSTIAAAISFSSPFDTFGVTNLQLNLISNPPSGAPIVSWTSVTTPAPGVTQVIAFTTPTGLGSGDYTLEVRGNLTQPGSYSGSLIASPVPLPAALLPFAAGLAVMGSVKARRRGRHQPPAAPPTT
ncbi:MAG TPA: FxDxF family PEP-CTERM protein [Caldimonas sp.]|nr:FxDxF family PEP-CTERM protein [Caldimonas sp.]